MASPQAISLCLKSEPIINWDSLKDISEVNHAESSVVATSYLTFFGHWSAGRVLAARNGSYVTQVRNPRRDLGIGRRDRGTRHQVIGSALLGGTLAALYRPVKMVINPYCRSVFTKDRMSDRAVGKSTSMTPDGAV